MTGYVTERMIKQMSKFRSEDVDSHLSQIDSNFGVVELTDTATQQHPLGSFFIWKSKFVKAKAAINVGDTISSSNVEDTSVADLITSANAAIDGKQDKLINPLVQADIMNNLSTTTSGKVLDARQGKALNDKITGSWVNITAQSPSSEITIIPTDNYRTTGYIISGRLCFVNIAMSVTANIGSVSKIVLSNGVLPTPLSVPNGGTTYRPMAWESFGGSEKHSAESLFQSGALYIQKAVIDAYTLSFVYPIANP